MDRTESMALWRRLLASFAQSKMTVRQWCEQQGVSLHQYYYWRRRIAAPAKQAGSQAQWMAIDVVAPAPVPTAPGRLTLRIAGAEIDVQPGFDPVLLRTVVHTLRSQPC